MGPSERIAFHVMASRDQYIRSLRRRIECLENEADAAEQHARTLHNAALNLSAELWSLEEGDPGTETD